MFNEREDCSAKILIVDHKSAIRTAMSQVLIGIGYHVSFAEDGLSALAEIGKEIPDIIFSDLSVPGMSAFELLSMVRRRYPSIRVIAMSGAFTGEEASSGIAVDAFYQKGCSAGSLLKIISAQCQLERRSVNQRFAPEPNRSTPKEHYAFGEHTLREATNIHVRRNVLLDRLYLTRHQSSE
jgi:DNA-binding NtrC family response regulator